MDTHAAVKNLVTAGLAEETAEAIVEVCAARDDDVATRADLTALELRLTLRMGFGFALTLGILIPLVALT